MKSRFLLIIAAMGIASIIAAVSFLSQPVMMNDIQSDQDTGLRLVDDDLQPKQLQRVLDLCACQESGNECIEPIFSYSNETHSIDTITCQWKKQNS